MAKDAGAKERPPILTRANLKAFLLVNLGVLLLTTGVYFFKLPNNFSTGGVSGISIILGSLIPGISTATFCCWCWDICFWAGSSAFGRPIAA